MIVPPPNRISVVDFMSLRIIFSISPKLTRPAFHRNISTQTTTMAAAIPKNRGGGKDETGTLIKQLVNNDSIGGWEKCWEQELTPWDLGKPTPILMNLIESGCLPTGRVLVPGCGTGYDVEAIASPERYAVGLDISEIAVTKARELFSLSKNANHFAFLKEDFFTWNLSSLFDLIFDYTFFCAIEPSMRPAWARRVHDLLKPDGELITLMFPIDDITGGPPYKVSVADYEEVLHPLGFKATSLVNNELAVGLRKGREKLGRWKRCLNKSRL